MSPAAPPHSTPVDPLTGVTASRLGLYVHFPYCLAKCPYCDFAVTVARQVPEERYAQAVVRELSLRLAADPGLRGRQLDSVFFGGGTPSLWDARWLGLVLEAVAEAFSLSSEVEISLEANPERSDAGRFEGYRAAGVNRLSLGVQSFEPSTLQALGRAHDAGLVGLAVERARGAGFDNLSMDFIYGVQGQSVGQAVADAQRAVALGPEHLSAYALTVERPALAEDTPLAKALARGQLRLPPDEEVVAMADAIHDVYAAHGLLRYEISNHARPGRHSRHNALYWTGGEYLALGTGATGTVAGVRTVNHRSTERYLASVEAGRLPEAEREALSPVEQFEERLALGLRLVGGVDLEAVCREFGQEAGSRWAEVARLERHGLAVRGEGRVALTRKGAHLHSEICARLV